MSVNLCDECGGNAGGAGSFFRPSVFWQKMRGRGRLQCTGNEPLKHAAREEDRAEGAVFGGIDWWAVEIGLENVELWVD